MKSMKRFGEILSIRALLLTLGLLGYWSFGKSFAYLGIYPLYIGEVLMVLGVIGAISTGKVAVLRKKSSYVFWTFFWVAMTQGVVSVLTGHSVSEVVRNLAVVYYGLFAWITYAFFVRARTQGVGMSDDQLTNVLSRISGWVLLGSTISLVVVLTSGSALPRFPGTDVPVLYYKPTDAIVPVAIVMTLWLQGHVSSVYGMWALGLSVVAASRSRSAMLVFFMALATSWRPNRRTILLGLLIGCLTAILIGLDVRIDLGYREISAQQLMANLLSLVSPGKAAELDYSTLETSSWRLSWWRAILIDSIENWRVVFGLGWGANLADIFRFQTADAETLNVLRSPHNALMGVLGRGGWVSAVLWISFYGSFLMEMVMAWRKSHNRARRSLIALVVIYTCGALINGMTDVYLESPQNAIPHWIVVGIGWSLASGTLVPSRKGATGLDHDKPTQCLELVVSDVCGTPERHTG